MTTEPLAWLNGNWIPFSRAQLSVTDQGVVHGAAVTEMVRTFQKVAFRLDDHLERLQNSLAGVGFGENVDFDELAAVTAKLVEQNGRLIPAGQELGIITFVTAGLNPTYLGAAARDAGETVCAHTFVLPFELWAKKYESGQHLIVPEQFRQPPLWMDARIKSRSRLPWLLADREVRKTDPTAQAVWVDERGFLTETSTANVAVYSDGKLCIPNRQQTLGGVSLKVLLELADSLSVPVKEMEISVEMAAHSEELFLTSTPYCLLPGTKLNGKPIGNGSPGPLFRKFMAAWNDLVGVDIIQQMSLFH